MTDLNFEATYDASTLELAASIYELALKYSKDDCTLKTAVCLTILLGLSLPDAWQYTLEVAKRRVSR